MSTPAATPSNWQALWIKIKAGLLKIGKFLLKLITILGTVVLAVFLIKEIWKVLLAPVPSGTPSVPWNRPAGMSDHQIAVQVRPGQTETVNLGQSVPVEQIHAVAVDTDKQIVTVEVLSGQTDRKNNPAPIANNALDSLFPSNANG